MEIKNSTYSRVGQKIKEVLDIEADITCGRRPAKNRAIPAVLGLIIRENEPITEQLLKDLIEKEKAVVLLKKKGDQYHPNLPSLLRLVNFLADVRERAKQLENLRLSSTGFRSYIEDSATTHW